MQREQQERPNRKRVTQRQRQEKEAIYREQLTNYQAITICLDPDEKVAICLEESNNIQDTIVFLYPGAEFLELGKTVYFTSTFSILSLTNSTVSFYSPSRLIKKVAPTASSLTEQGFLKSIETRINDGDDDVNGLVFTDKILAAPEITECYKKCVSLVHCIHTRLLLRSVTPVVFFTGSPGSGRASAMKTVASLLKKTTGSEGCQVMIIDLDPASYEVGVPGCFSCMFYGEKNMKSRESGKYDMNFSVLSNLGNGQCAIYPFGATSPEFCFNDYLLAVESFMNNVVTAKLGIILSKTGSLDYHKAKTSNKELYFKDSINKLLEDYSWLEEQKQPLVILIRIPSLMAKWEISEQAKMMKKEREPKIGTIEELNIEQTASYVSIAKLRNLIYYILDSYMHGKFKYIWPESYKTEKMQQTIKMFYEQQMQQKMMWTPDLYPQYEDSETIKPNDSLIYKLYDYLLDKDPFLGVADEKSLLGDEESDGSFDSFESEDDEDKNEEPSDTKQEDEEIGNTAFDLIYKPYIAPIFFNIGSPEIYKMLSAITNLSLAEEKYENDENPLNLKKIRPMKMLPIYNLNSPMYNLQAKAFSSTNIAKEKQLPLLQQSLRFYFKGFDQKFLLNRTKIFYIYSLKPFQKTDNLYDKCDSNVATILERVIIPSDNRKLLGTRVYSPDSKNSVVGKLMLILQVNRNFKTSLWEKFILTMVNSLNVAINNEYKNFVNYLERANSLNEFSVVGFSIIHSCKQLVVTDPNSPLEILVELPSPTLDYNANHTLVLLNTNIAVKTNNLISDVQEGGTN